MKKGVLRIAVLFFCLCECIDAQDVYPADSLRKVLQAAKDDSSKVNTLNLLSRSLYVNGNFDEAVNFANSSEKLARSLQYDKGLGTALNHQGNIYYYKGDYAAAMEKHSMAIEIRKAINDQKGLGSSYINLGNIFKEQANYPRALECYFRSLAMREGLNDKQGIYACLNNVGSVYERMRDNKKALEYFEKALKVCNGSDRYFMAGMLINMGNIYMNGLNYAKALENYKAALEKNTEVGNKKGVSIALSNLGNAYDGLEQYDTAMVYYTRALQFENELNENSGTITVLMSMAGNFMKRKRYAEAEAYCLKSMKLASESGGSEEDHMLAEKLLSGVYEQTGRSQEAFKHYRIYIAERDSFFNEENTKKNVRAEMNYEFDKREEASRAEQEKKELMQVADRKRQNVVLFSISGFGILVLGFAIFAYRSFLEKKRVNIEIIRQKQLIEEKQKEILDSIHYAKRIQRSLMPNERYLTKYLS